MSLPSGLLSLASPLGWESEEVPRLGVCCTAWIPKVRIEDFVKGEGERGHTHFVRQHCYENGEYDVHHYQCCCGPEDFSQNVASDSCIASQARKKPREYGDSRKRGCLASFQIMLHHGVSAVRIQCRKADLEHWKNHTNAAGAICHGPDCPHAGKYRAAPGLSKACRDYVIDRLLLGIQPTAIQQQWRAEMHVQYAQKHGLQSAQAAERAMNQGELGLNADYYLTIKDIANIRRSIDGLEWKFDGDQAQCLREFARANPELVLCYQEYDPDTSTPFFIGVTTSDLLDVAVRYGHGRPASIDSTFATNNLKFPLYTLMVYDHLNNGVPVAFFVPSSATGANVAAFLAAFRDKCRERKADFAFNCLLTDNDAAQLQALSEVMPETKPLLCGYHARVAWAKHLANTVVEEADRKAIADALDGLIRFNDLAAPWNTMDVHLRAAANRALEGFYELLRGLGPAGGAFLTYFKTTWEPKVEMWMQLFRNMDHCNQETTGAIEKYHGVLKGSHLSDMPLLKGRRLDKLVFRLLTQVAGAYLHKLGGKETGFYYSRKLELETQQTAHRALLIPEADMVLPTSPDQPAFVKSSAGKETYIVTNPGTPNACCNCSYCRRGNACKHLMKGRLRMPLSDLVVESAAATGRATTSVPFPAAAAPQNWLLQQLETARPATVAVAQVQSGGDFGPGGASLLAAAHVGTTLPQTLASGGTQSTSPPVIKAAAAHGRGHKRERKATRAQQLYEEQENLEF